MGKTSLAAIVAAELGVGFRVTSGPALERAGDLAAILTGLEAGDVLFVDEIHRLPRAVEEVLYPAMEDFQIDVVLGKGPGARSLRLDLPRFTLVAATTRTGLITSPLRDRFGFAARLDYYAPADLQAIVTRSAAILGVATDQAGAADPAGHVDGDPVRGPGRGRGVGHGPGQGLVGRRGRLLVGRRAGRPGRGPGPDDPGADQRDQGEHGDRDPLAAGAREHRPHPGPRPVGRQDERWRLRHGTPSGGRQRRSDGIRPRPGRTGAAGPATAEPSHPRHQTVPVVHTPGPLTPRNLHIRIWIKSR